MNFGTVGRQSRAGDEGIYDCDAGLCRYFPSIKQAL